MSKQKKSEIRYIVGVDEVGRGPLAGPVAVGIVCIPFGFRHAVLVRAKDSKMLSPKIRKDIFEEIKVLKRQEHLSYSVSMVHAEAIDRKGISQAIRICIKQCLRKCNISPENTRILLDGSLKAPEEFIYQKTIIKGDQKEKVISLASIIAKVTRDKWMENVARKYPDYGFEVHKGYGTLFHRKMIKEKGVLPIHRKSFLKKYI